VRGIDSDYADLLCLQARQQSLGGKLPILHRYEFANGIGAFPKFVANRSGAAFRLESASGINCLHIGKRSTAIQSFFCDSLIALRD
jgi:hypothetical protein